MYSVRAQMVFTSVTLAFGLLHLIIYLFQPRSKSDLYFSISLFLFAGTIFFDFQEMMFGNIDALRIQRAFLSLTLFFFLLFISELFLPKRPKQFYVLGIGLGVAGLLAVWQPNENFKYLSFVTLVFWGEVIRIQFIAVKQKTPGAWFIAVGTGALFLAALYDLLLDTGVLLSVAGINNGYPFGLLALFISTSVYLAKDMSETNKQMVKHEVSAREKELQRKLMQVEMDRKSAELEEARLLQLSMLPARLPDVADLDIAVHMTTATEVGGDYYDFHQAEDNSLIVAVGDATGHGLKAGMMVTIAKSFFMNTWTEADLPTFFQRCTKILKQMNLGNLFMGMTLLRIHERTITASAAGMPPFLVYRAATRDVEIKAIKGMPMGAFNDFPYSEIKFSMDSGDVIMMLSDGLEEAFNADREMLGMDRITDELKTVGHLTADEIVGRMTKLGDDWMNSSRQDDDITIVVLKAT
jgi:serine phosphatase RsbU (regulator of sigma subunit)